MEETLPPPSISGGPQNGAVSCTATKVFPAVRGEMLHPIPMVLHIPQSLWAAQEEGYITVTGAVRAAWRRTGGPAVPWGCRAASQGTTSEAVQAGYSDAQICLTGRCNSMPSGSSSGLPSEWEGWGSGGAKSPPGWRDPKPNSLTALLHI